MCITTNKQTTTQQQQQQQQCGGCIYRNPDERSSPYYLYLRQIKGTASAVERGIAGEQLISKTNIANGSTKKERGI